MEYHSIPRTNWGSFRGRREEKWGSFRGGIILGSIWGSFQGWGSFRGQDHFGGCTEMKNKGYTKFWGANEVHYGRCARGVFHN